MDMGDHQHTAANGKQQRAVVSTARTKGGELLAGCATEEARRWSADLNELLVVELRSNSTTGSSVPAPDSSALKERHHLDRYNSDAQTPPPQHQSEPRVPMGFPRCLRSKVAHG